MTQRRPLLAIVCGVSLLFLVAVIVGVTFCIRHAEKQRLSIEASQSLDDRLPQMAETLSSTTDPAEASRNLHGVSPQVPEPSSAAAAPPGSQASQLTWHAVGNWTGEHGSKETERFTIGGSEWRISWKTTGASGRVCALGIYVYDSSGAFVTLAALRQGVESDVSYVHAQPGQFYLSVISCAADWEIAVEDWY